MSTPDTPSPTVALAAELIRRESVTPNDRGCQDLLVSRLEPLGFTTQRLRFGEVDNLWMRRNNDGPLLVLAGHTDVVPTGPLEQWTHPPFAAHLDSNNVLHGRGAADMKGSLAAMVTACERFLTEHPDHKGSIAFLITSDEEGPARDGTAKVVKHLMSRNERIDWCLIGEPSSSKKTGDVVKNGRRGSLHGHLTVHGIQGHIAYPHLASNPIHSLAPALADLTSQQWDSGNEHFPPTSFQVWEVRSGDSASNVIPGNCQLNFNFRFSTEVTAQQLQERVTEILDGHKLNYTLAWHLSGDPFLTPEGPLLDATVEAIRSVTGIETALSTSGGTSDGRFIAPAGAQVVELGPVNATIHKVNEQVSASELDDLSRIYADILKRLLV